MAGVRIFGLAELIKTMIKICGVIGKFGPGIRNFVPEESRETYDAALAAILAACDVLRAIDYADGLTSTNPPWGS